MKSILRLALSCLTIALAIPACSAAPDEAVGTTEAKQTSGAASFCPMVPVKRADMARYLERMKKGRDFTPPAARGIFPDVPRGSDDEPWIEALFADGITRGCGTQTDLAFCANDLVPREQMAAFLMRLVHGPDYRRPTTSRFVDAKGVFEGDIEQLATDGITLGCDATHFCPKENVNREQMAAFLMRAIHPGPDPRGTGVFQDVSPEDSLAGRVEQAVEEGIMEPCANSLESFDQMPRSSVNVIALRPTDRNGLVNAPVTKYFGSAWIEDQCGGSYYVHVAADIGRVTGDSIELRDVTYFYPGSAEYLTYPRGWMDAASNGTSNTRSENGHVRLDENGTAFQTFYFYETFYDVRAPHSGLVLSHWVEPKAPYVPGFGGAAVCGMHVKTLLQVVD